MKRILILGGYGFFGARIGAALAAHPAVTVLLGGRDGPRARAAAHSMGLPPECAVALDARDANLPDIFRRLRLDAVVHTAGPFQGQDYAVARAAIEAGCHYVDLADGRQFVTGIDTLAADAKARAVTVVSGASSVPALSAAVVDRYLPKFGHLDSIEIGISSGARTPGLATVTGVFSYGGKTFRVWKNGGWADAYGWLDLHRHKFPRPLGARWLGNCDVPDLELFPRRYPAVRTVSFQAGSSSDIAQLVVWSLARLVKTGVVREMAGYAASLNRVSRWLEPLMSDKGGMFVSLKGAGPDRRRLSVTWNLVARKNHGPNIPCAAAIALVCKMAEGHPLPTGAMPCMGLLTVEEFLAPLGDLDIHESVQQ